ncbi:hypothetical protein JCM17845_21870 [Iodidimonas gelatinilytica]|uniref:Porin domain-containing protein n=1 Tax=Iodidimonas gelatinilytica TaxID=1236966 RepID=A0A5A7N1K3_9PROT|nr:porin [Iodidimonas gelatinilytica]GER01564.1 hypothetical protein JCM17845_21870 [Iodidimonas gelatinilytica]
MQKTFLKGLAATALCLAFTAPVNAADAPRFKSSGFLQSLDLFTDQSAYLNAEEERAARLKIDFAFRSEQASEEPGFLYLRDEDDDADMPPIPVSRPITNFTPRISALGGLDRGIDAGGQARILSSFTPRYATSEMTLSFAPQKTSDVQDRVNLALRSEFLVEQSPTSSAFAPYDQLSPYDRQSVNVGLSVGYLGFVVGATITRETGGLLDDIEGFDVGFGYEWSAFSTQISVGEYNRTDAQNGLVGLDNQFHKLELGAAYAVSERLRVSGGVRLFDYGNRFSLDPDSADRSGLLYLGTRLNF